jgi:hypothetical protein
MSLPAPDLPTLQNFEPQLTHAAQRILAAGGFDLSWQRGDSGVRPNAATAVTVDIGEATGRLGVRPEGVTEHSQFTASLSIMVAIERSDNEAANDGKGTPLDRECARVRTLFLNHPNPFAGKTEYIQVNSIVPRAPIYNTDPEDAIDSRILVWELLFTIPDEAWPVVRL